MAAGEDQAKPVVREAAVAPEAHVVLLSSTLGEGALELGELQRLAARPPDPVQRPIPGRGRDPGPGVPRHAVPRPRLEGGDERVGDRLLGEVEVAEDPDERGQDPTGFLAEGPLDVLADRVRDQPATRAAALSGSSMSRIGRTSIEP